MKKILAWFKSLHPLILYILLLFSVCLSFFCVVRYRNLQSSVVSLDNSYRDDIVRFDSRLGRLSDDLAFVKDWVVMTGKSTNYGDVYVNRSNDKNKYK